MRRVLLFTTAAIVGVGLSACSTTSQHASHSGDQPTPGTTVQTQVTPANPPVVPASATTYQSRVSIFETKKDCKL